MWEKLCSVAVEIVSLPSWVEISELENENKNCIESICKDL